MSLSLEEWRARFAAVEHGAFHLELRDSYGVAEESSRFGRWLAGERESYADVAEWFRDWTGKVRAITSTGRSVHRVRVVTEPISPYIAFEHHDTPHNIAAGEDIRWLPRHQLPEGIVFPVGGNDWWLLDDSALVVNHFDADGRSSSRELIEDPVVVAACVQVRDLLWGQAIPHADYPPVTA
ncbi:DUF6879 family protein [Streptosporangium sp. NPDC051022]|uniref:DUF6879 family protein n=1 Tax=Streptosporangium sp. NPDC051022 TaxID=3155752 RepID=UPI00341A0669